MNNTFKILAIGLLSLVALLGFSATAFALAVDTNYVPLVTIPGVLQAGKATNPVSVLKGIYGLAIGIGSVIAVIMIIFAGLKYIYEESIVGKSGAREQIQNAFIGLFVILGSYILLRTVNPDLVNFDFTLQGGRGVFSTLVTATQALDNSNRLAAIALQDSTKLTGDINTLKSSAADIQKKIDALGLNSESSAADQEQADKYQAQLDQINKDIQDKTVTKALTTTGADALTAVTSIDENIVRIAASPSASTAEKANLVVNIEGKQRNADAFFDQTLADLAKFDQNDVNVQKAIATTQAKKDAMDAEFAQQKTMNTAFNNSNDIKNAGDWQKVLDARKSVIQDIRNDVATYTKRLKDAGLPDDASAFTLRAQNRLAALCNVGKICAQ